MIAGRHSMMASKTPAYPWDYRVEYFQVATTYPCFECGPLSQYQPSWSVEEAKDASSQLAVELRNNFLGWAVFSFPQSLSTDQKIFGNGSVFTIYPYSRRYNAGCFQNWCTSSYPSFSSVSSINTKTRVSLWSSGSNIITYRVAQGNTNVDWNETLASTRKVSIWSVFPICLYAEWSSYQISRVYVGTRIYEVGIDITPPSFDALHVRFVPCMKDGRPYICELNSGKMIPNSMSGTVTPGPQVADNFQAWG